MFPVSWDQFHRDSRALAWRLNASGPFAAIVGITRGGLVPAGIVARELGIRVIETVCVSSYDGTRQKQAGPGFYTVPTAPLRSGDFSGVTTVIYDPTSGNPDGSGRTATAR